MWTCAGVIFLLAAGALGITRDQLYPHGPGLDLELPRGAEVASPEIQLQVPIRFYGETYESIYVNNYGVLTFRSDLPTFWNAEFPLPYPSIAAFYSNIDTSESGVVYYRETTEPRAIAKAEESIQNNFHDYYEFRPSSVFITTWVDTKYSNGIKRNTFQAAIISNGTESFVEFLYPEYDIQWIQKETAPNAMPDAKAQAGFIAEDGRVYNLRGSGSHQIRNIMTWSNVNEPGKYVFRVGNILPNGNVGVPDQYNQAEIEQEEEYKTCAVSGPSICHMQAKCVDYKSGICCQCNDGYYGNGKSCIRIDVPLRVHGKLNGALNNVNLNDIDMQAYVVVADGRSYTALSQVPPTIGHELLFLNALGGVIGWLFAKPTGNALNGYQLTSGLFNYTAEIHFPSTNDRVIINQKYLGHDVFDQVVLDADVRGSVPNLGSQLEISEYEEQYTIVEPGLVRSETTRTFRDKDTGATYEERISQTITFAACPNAPPAEEKVMTLRVGKNFLGYEDKTSIIRYGMSNKITPLGQEEDPCVRGRSVCGSHTCVVQGDSFVCVCQPGFTNAYEDNTMTCVDVDECSTNMHSCSENAECVNYDGGYECRCNGGYEGDGKSCRPITQCEDKRCDVNANCVENGPEGATCVCNPGFTGNGEQCWQTLDEQERNICDDCSSYADCEVNSWNEKMCQCKRGFVGDGFRCSPDITSTTERFENNYNPGNDGRFPPVCSQYDCICPTESTYITDENGEGYCQPNTNYDTHQYPQEYNSTSLKCSNHQDCPTNAYCEYSTSVGDYECRCLDGYEGTDPYECREARASTCNCGANAFCTQTVGNEQMCVCDRGYHGDGYTCRPNFSCFNDSNCELNAECRFDPLTGGDVCQCIEGYVKDQNDACILDLALCNGAVCAEHASCLYDTTIDVHYCHCDEGYEGEGIEKCIPLGYSCDVANDCHPDADCRSVEETYKCVCREGFVGDGYSCDAEPNCRNIPELCHAYASCLKKNNDYFCECNSGYTGNGTYCETNPKKPGNFLAASDGTFIYRVPFEITARDIATPINAEFDMIAVAIDVDCQTGRIYWSDIVSGMIKGAAYDGSSVEKFLETEIKTPEGIAIDWSARNIFWTDSKKKTIEVANIDTKLRKVLVTYDSYANLRGITVHPSRGKVFWSDWYRHAPKIEWANMDGTERGVFLASPDVVLPNSLAIDWSTESLCYADAGLKTIECVNIDTRQRRTIVTNCAYPFGLAIKDNRFYWSDWKTLKIEFFDVSTNERGHLPISTTSRKLYGVAVAPEQCAPSDNVCQYRNGNCNYDEICLPNGRGGRTCAMGL